MQMGRMVGLLEVGKGIGAIRSRNPSHRGETWDPAKAGSNSCRYPHPMGVSIAFATLLLLVPQQPATRAPVVAQPAGKQPARATVAVDTGLVVVHDGVSLSKGCLLGDGGVVAATRSVAEASSRRGARASEAPFRSQAGTCTTPGGVVVQCRREGVKLTFPNGRELLYAPDGHMHLRDGSEAGPFLAGIELRLADGTAVAIDRSGSRRAPIECVEVRNADESVCLFRRGNPTSEDARGAFRLPVAMCLGDGGSVYRAIALGPLVTLDRLLTPLESQMSMPERRLCVLAGPLVDSMELLCASRAQRRHPESVQQLQLILSELESVFRKDAPMPPRTGSDPLQYLLHAGFDLRFAQEKGLVRMQLARNGAEPFVEWRLGYATSICGMSATTEEGSGAEVVAPPMPDLQAQLQYHEIDSAIHVVAALAKGEDKKRVRR